MKSRFVSEWVESFLATRPVRANSLIITVYGDAIAPHGGTVWLGSFIRLVEPLGLNPRMVRTSVFRLSREKWLVSQQIGRKSFYSLTPVGNRRFEHAYRRIYHLPQDNWNGEWQIVFIGLPGIDASQREAVKRDLLWEGFGILAPGVLAHPLVDADGVQEILNEAGVHDKVVVMRAASQGAFSARPIQELAANCWNLEDIALHYKVFVDRFRPALRALRAAHDINPEQAFLVRTLLIHEYRRVLLRDPQLPQSLLQGGWPGATARELATDLYRLVCRAAEDHLLASLETTTGQLPEAAPYFFERFGGLSDATETPLATA